MRKVPAARIASRLFRLCLGAAVFCMLAACSGASPAKKAGHPHTTPKTAAKPSPAALQAQDEIQALYSQRDGAFAQKDFDAMYAPYAPDFVSVGVTGMTSTLPEIREVLTKIGPMIITSGQASIIQGVTMDGDNAVVTVHEHTDMMLARPTDHAVGHLVEDDVARDFWEKTTGGWQLKRSRNLTDRMSVNGKPVPVH